MPLFVFHAKQFACAAYCIFKRSVWFFTQSVENQQTGGCVGGGGGALRERGHVSGLV